MTNQRAASSSSAPQPQTTTNTPHTAESGLRPKAGTTPPTRNKKTTTGAKTQEQKDKGKNEAELRSRFDRPSIKPSPPPTPPPTEPQISPTTPNNQQKPEQKKQKPQTHSTKTNHHRPAQSKPQQMQTIAKKTTSKHSTHSKAQAKNRAPKNFANQKKNHTKIQKKTFKKTCPNPRGCQGPAKKAHTKSLFSPSPSPLRRRGGEPRRQSCLQSSSLPRATVDRAARRLGIAARSYADQRP